MSRKRTESGFGKALFLTALLALTLLSTSIVLTAYPQHLFINDGTIINSDLKFTGNNTVSIKGNQVPFSQNDIIPIEGRDYIRVVGKQVQLGESIFTPAIRTITASITQSVIFEQKVGEFNINKVAQVGIENTIINIIPASKSTLNIRTKNSNYIIEFLQNNTYIKSNDVMLRLNKNGDKISVYIVGFKNYESIWMRTI